MAKRPPGRIADLQRAFREGLPAALDAVGLYLVGAFQSAFRKQGRGVSWAPRAPINRIGILMDLQAGRTPPSRRFESRPAAIDTGRLVGSIAHEVRGREVVVGSNLSYASDVQRGSTKSIEMTPSLRQALAAYLRKNKSPAVQAAMGPLFNIDTLEVTVPPRPFVVITPDDRTKIQEIARRVISRVGR